MPIPSWEFYGTPEIYKPAIPMLDTLAGHISQAHQQYLKTIERLTKQAEPLYQALSTMRLGGKELLGPGARAIASVLGQMYRTVGGLTEGFGALPVQSIQAMTRAAVAPYSALSNLAYAGLAPYSAQLREAQAQQLEYTLKPNPFVSSFFQKLSSKLGISSSPTTGEEQSGGYTPYLYSPEDFMMTLGTIREQGYTPAPREEKRKESALPMLSGWF